MSISPGVIDINQTVLEISTRKLDNYQFMFKFAKPVGITNQHPFSNYIHVYICDPVCEKGTSGEFCEN